MSERFEVLFYGDVINCVRDENGKEYNLQELIEILMDQQTTINKLQELVAELGATLLMNGFEIEINGENLSELIDDE